MVGWAFSAGNGYYNAFNSNWYTVTDYASGGNMAAHILNPGGNLASAQFNHWPQSIAGKHDASNNIVYLCDSYSGKLWKRNVTGGTEVEVVLEAPFTDKVRCDTGRSLIYNAERNTLIIGADFQGAYGLLEIPAP
jgi:hypothetical protein